MNISAATLDVLGGDSHSLHLGDPDSDEEGDGRNIPPDGNTDVVVAPRRHFLPSFSYFLFLIIC